MTGLGHMLKALGIDPEEILQQFETLKVALPQFANGLKGKVDEIDQRLVRLEQQQLTMLALLHEINGSKPTELVSLVPEPVAGFKPATEKTETQTVYQFEREDAANGTNS